MSTLMGKFVTYVGKIVALFTDFEYYTYTLCHFYFASG